MHVHCQRLFVVFQEIQCLLNFHYDVGRQGIEIYPCIKFCLSHCFSLSVTSTYIIMPLRMYQPRLFLCFSKKYTVYIILTMAIRAIPRSLEVGGQDIGNGEN